MGGETQAATRPARGAAANGTRRPDTRPVGRTALDTRTRLRACAEHVPALRQRQRASHRPGARRRRARRAHRRAPARLAGIAAEAGANPGTVHKARTLLSSVLRHAAESEAKWKRSAARCSTPCHGKSEHRCAGSTGAAATELPVPFSTYAYLIDEYAEHGQPVDAEAEIAKARAMSCASEVRHGAH